MKSLRLRWSTFNELAVHILGNDFLSLPEIESAYGFSYTSEQKELLAASAPEEMMLMFAKRHQCTLIPTLPVDYNLFEFYTFNNPTTTAQQESWLLSPTLLFPHDELLRGCQWLMVSKYPRLFSLEKTWSDQAKLVSRFEYIPKAVEVVYAITTLHKLRGIRCLDQVVLRTVSIDRCGQHVTVGDINLNGFDVNTCWNGYSKKTIGLGTAVKSKIRP